MQDRGEPLRGREKQDCKKGGFLNLAFGTVPLGIDQWLLCAVMASGVLWLSELRKLATRAWARRRAA